MPQLPGLACSLFVLAVPALAGSNGPDRAQAEAEEGYLPKLNLACGTRLTLIYDAESLARHNRDIRYDQTGGANECNEPLRYLWYLCKGSVGRETVKAARLSKVLCRGTADKTGSLTLAAGTLTVERAFEEDQPFLRSRNQFEAIFRTKIELGDEDPYQDREWNDLKFKPNPVTDAKNYCLVNDEKVAWNEWVFEPFRHRREDATVKCWKGGELITSLTLKKGVKTGYETHFRDAVATRSASVDGLADGEQRTTTNGRPTEVTLFAKGKEQWRTEYHASGRLSRHSRTHPDHIDEISLADDGKVHSVSCSPQARDDKELRRWCGFDGEVTHRVYDGTGKVSHVVTLKDGLVLHEGPGTSDYASRRDVSYRDGKKHGEERIVDKTGKLRSSTSWRLGAKDGKELEYAEDGKRIVTETVWKLGDLQQVTELYLNGNPKQREVFSSKKQKQRQRFWDTGKVSAEGTLVACPRGYRDWCEDGVHKTYYESGAPESETTWKSGQRHGVAKRWWESGRQADLAEYAEGKLATRRSWDKDGKLTLDEEYEEDGSRKLSR